MFTRESKHRIDTLIGKATSVSGDVEFVGGLHVDGRVAGNVRSDQAPGTTLTVSETGSIEGGVEVPNVTLDGTVIGDIQARGKVVIGPTARVEGNVFYGVIEMTLGAQITGKLMRLAPEAPAGAAAEARAPADSAKTG